jgi:hypothetical protein
MPCHCVYTFSYSCVTTNTSTDHIKFATPGFKLLAAERSTAAAVTIAATASATNTDVFVTAVGTVCKPDPAQEITTHPIPLRSPHNPFKYCVLCSVIRYVLVGVSANSMQARAPLEVAADLGPPHAMPCFGSAASSVFFPYPRSSPLRLKERRPRRSGSTLLNITDCTFAHVDVLFSCDRKCRSTGREIQIHRYLVFVIGRNKSKSGEGSCCDDASCYYHCNGAD